MLYELVLSQKKTLIHFILNATKSHHANEVAREHAYTGTKLALPPLVWIVTPGEQRNNIINFKAQVSFLLGIEIKECLSIVSQESCDTHTMAVFSAVSSPQSVEEGKSGTAGVAGC